MKRQGWTGAVVVYASGNFQRYNSKVENKSKRRRVCWTVDEFNAEIFNWNNLTWQIVELAKEVIIPFDWFNKKNLNLAFPVIIMLLFIQSICLSRHFSIISCRLLGSTRAMWFTLITKSSAKLVSEELVIIRQKNNSGHGWKENTFQANRSHDKTHRHSNKTVDGVRLIGL